MNWLRNCLLPELFYSFEPPSDFNWEKEWKRLCAAYHSAVKTRECNMGDFFPRSQRKCERRMFIL